MTARPNLPEAWARLGNRLRRKVFSIVGVYAVVAGAWIAVSDRLLGAFVRDSDDLVRFGAYKGFFFVAVTAGFLFLLLHRTAKRLEHLFAELDRKEAERRHQEAARRRAEAIVESTDDAIVGKTLGGTITSFNPAAERLFGFSAAEAVGATIDILIPPDCLDDEAAVSQRILSAAGRRQYETFRKRRDGHTFPVAITQSPILDLAGEPGSPARVVGMSEIVRDITERREAESAVEREQRFTNGLIGAMPGVFYLYDESGRFLRWNRNFEVVSGYSGEEIARMHPLDFFAERDRNLLKERIAEVFEKGESSVEAPFVTKSGVRIPYFFTGKRIDFDGKTCLVGVGVDIEQRVQAESALRRSEERYRSTLESMMEGCQILDFDFRYLYLNDAAARHNRRPNSDLLGKRMPDAWPGIEASPVFALLDRCMRGRAAQQDEIEFVYPDGAKGWFHVRCQPVPEGVFVLSMDISERKRAERALRDLNESLELKVRERTIDLDAAKERAEQADRIKSAFLATMSHELRTPLNSILGFTGIILQGLAGPLTAEQQKQLGMVQGSARHLLDLINDVLDISKIEAGQLTVRSEPFSLDESIARVVASVTPLAQKKGLSLEVVQPDPGTLGTIESDRRRVEQILLNLLNNAIKFTDTGRVTLTVDVPAASSDSAAPTAGAAPVVRIRVSDTGIGIKPEDLAKLFQPFRQIDSGLQRQHEGTGLGLAICRRLTELLGGTIATESVWREGSTFTVTLPLKRSSSS